MMANTKCYTYINESSEIETQLRQMENKSFGYNQFPQQSLT